MPNAHAHPLNSNDTKNLPPDCAAQAAADVGNYCSTYQRLTSSLPVAKLTPDIQQVIQGLFPPLIPFTEAHGPQHPVEHWRLQCRGSWNGRSVIHFKREHHPMAVKISDLAPETSRHKGQPARRFDKQRSGTRCHHGPAECSQPKS
mgnify:CR=1 FL=1